MLLCLKTVKKTTVMLCHGNCFIAAVIKEYRVGHLRNKEWGKHSDSKRAPTQNNEQYQVLNLCLDIGSFQKQHYVDPRS